MKTNPDDNTFYDRLKSLLGMLVDSKLQKYGHFAFPYTVPDYSEGVTAMHSVFRRLHPVRPVPFRSDGPLVVVPGEELILVDAHFLLSRTSTADSMKL